MSALGHCRWGAARSGLLLASLLGVGCSTDRDLLATDAAVADLGVPATVDLATFQFPDLAIDRSHLDGGCVGQAEARHVRRPVDVIVAVDNGRTMTDAVVALDEKLAALAAGLQAGDVDYRIVLVSAFGGPEVQALCVPRPLSGNDCKASPLVGPPRNGPRLFQYDLRLDGPHLLDDLLASYRQADRWMLAANGWSGYLRQDSLKVFLFVSNDDAALPADQFVQALSALDPARFGPPVSPSYVVDTVAGLAANQGTADPWTPKDPFVVGTCGPSARDSGKAYQLLALQTGGLRFPVCDVTRYGAILATLGDTIARRSELPCELLLPKPPDGELNLDTLEVLYVSPKNVDIPVSFRQVASKALCGPNSFYLVDLPGEIHVALCPSTCQEVQADSKAILRLYVDCYDIP